MDATERYLFDLNGYLVVRDALPAEAVTAINRLMDERIARDVPSGATTYRFADVLDWGPEVRALIDHDRIAPYLEEILGTGYRLDHDYADLIRHGKGPIGTKLHGGAVPFDPGQSYTFVEGRPRSGLVVVAYNLCDVNPGDGGFGCVPGSHKANLPFPDEWRELEQDLDGLVRPVTGPAGTAILFTEAMTHGTLPWRGAGERRTLFLKYDPGPIAYGAAFYDRDRWSDLTPRQRAILESPNARYRGRPTA
jgi:ectoine hydroxylase-related dioxygenase (phytanoyl-CoA dioxygenase family)